jgi:hypothetical protein
VTSLLSDICPKGSRLLKFVIPHQALSAPVNLPLPAGAIVLSVSVDGVRPVLYVAGVGDAIEPRWFQLCWTADPVPELAQFLGTVKMPAAEGGSAVWHVFEFPLLRGKA